MIDKRVSVGDEIAQTDRIAHPLGQFAIDRPPVGQNEERRARIVGEPQFSSATQ